MCYVHAEPTGLLIDSAMKLLLPWIPEVSVNERREALHRASNLALTRGVTTVVDFGRYFPGVSAELSWEDFSGLSSNLLRIHWMFHEMIFLFYLSKEKKKNIIMFYFLDIT